MKHALPYHFATSCERPTDAVALRFKRGKIWISWTWKEYFRQAEAVAHGLIQLGIKTGDRVAILANSRWEWAALDFALLGMGAIVVPLYHNSRADEIEFILNHSGCKALVVGDDAQLRKWESFAKRCRTVQSTIVLFDVQTASSRNWLSWEDLCDRGAKAAAAQPGWFHQSCQSVELTRIASVVYTSGTTGEPKGVVIHHSQIMAEVQALTRHYPISAQDSTLSFLPYAHVLGRVELWLHAYVGFTLNIAETPDTLMRNLREVSPTVMIGVPRVFEKIHAAAQTKAQHQSLRRQVIQTLSQRSSHFLPVWLPAKNLIGQALDLPRNFAMDRLLHARLRQSLGGKLRFAVSGGAPLEPAVAEFFFKAGILVLEGYGLTETTAAITANTPGDFQFGTVGKPLAGVEIKLNPDGEILVRGGMVTDQYFEDADATDAAFENGFFKTGDIGEWTAEGFLRITDRKKDLIKTAGGKYVAPQKLEGLLKLDPLVSHALIHGDRQKYIVALITLDEQQAKSRARGEGWRYRDYKSLTQSAHAREAVRKIVAQVNSQLASHETIKNFAILPHDFTVESGELTPSLKVKRRVCDANYKDLLESLYT